MRWQFAFLLFITFLSSITQGQYYFYNDRYYNTRMLVEAGLSASAFNCLTDLGGGSGQGKPFLKDVNWKHTKPGGGVYISLLFDQLFGVRLDGNLAKVSASDHVLKDDHSIAINRFSRNLDFETTITELTLSAEFFPLSIFNKESYPLFSPYLLGGIGYFRFNPRSKLDGTLLDLQPLRTEGQGFAGYPDRQPYRLTQFCMPVGIGMKYEISALLNTRFEVIYRFLTTDYLDDVSTSYIDPKHFQMNLASSQAAQAIKVADRSHEIQPGKFNHEGAIRGNPQNRDSYFSFNAKLGVVLNRKRR